MSLNFDNLALLMPDDTYQTPAVCPKCMGHGRWNGSEKLCGQCLGLGYVESGSLDETCVHEWKQVAPSGKFGNRHHDREYKCRNCTRVLVLTEEAREFHRFAI